MAKKVVKPIIDDLKKNHPPAPVPDPDTPPKLQPAELDQDAGGGYNPDGTYPQT